jgi:hypothetical protein
MTHKTAILTDFDCYLASDDDSLEDRSEQRSLRDERLLHYPHAIMLQVAFPELDFVNRWCWMNFGSRDGDCTQKYSQYRVCQIDEPHSHSGVWTDHWFVKTEYDFGFNEWYFANDADYNAFLQNVPNINWGENYPK